MKKNLMKALSVFMIVSMIFSSIGMFAATSVYGYTYIANGIDVSAWQANITWPNVKASGIDFAILRIMASGKDRYFESNYTNAKAAGVKLGVYCYSYATTVAGAQAEATKVLNWLGGRKLEYPIYYDIEDSCQASLTTAQRTQLCIAFCDTIEAAGYRAGIYSGASWFNTKLDKKTLASKYEIWEAMWPTSNGVQVNSPIYDRSSSCSVWQYSSTGSVSGISGRVDMNVSYKDYATYMIEKGYNGYGGGAGVTPVTPSTCAPTGHGWQWPAAEAYGYMGNYGGNGQDIELCLDLCLLPSSAESRAMFYTNGTEKSMSVSQNTVTVGSTSVSYNWGALGMDNWHDVKFKILNGNGYVYIDGKLVAYGTGITANEAYQLLFANPGEMAIDNVVLMSSSGTTYFSCDFEDASAAQKLMGEGLGKRVDLFGVQTVTDNTCAPAGNGWVWPAAEAYGYMGNYGGNGQDIELCVDLALLPSEKDSKAVFYTNGTEKNMSVSKDTVTVGSTSVSYNWGSLGMNNWHDVKFKILNGTGYVFIDGELIASESGIVANESYQLLFANPGEMAIDNAVLMSSDGTSYFSCDFENGSQAQTLMGEGLGKRQLLFNIETVTPTEVAPSGYGWLWNATDAYGYMGNYGGNGDDVELCVDLALLPSAEESRAMFYTDGTTKNMSVSASAVTVGSTTVAYNWGELSLDNWHDVKFKILNGTGYVFIDGELIASEAGFTANDQYQLLFSWPGEMAIDNAILMSSTGTTYFNCNFEDASAAQKLMGEGLGARTLLFEELVDFDLSVSPASSTINGIGSVTLKATPTAGEGHTYSWSCSDSTLAKYMTTNGNTCTFNVSSELASAVSATVSCTATSSQGITASASASVNYKPFPALTFTSVTPENGTVTGAGSVTYTAKATGDGLTYSWSSSNAFINDYMTGADSASMTVTIPADLGVSFSTNITCTVSDSHGKSQTKTVTFKYESAPVPVISAVTPSTAEIIGAGSATYTATASGDGLTYSWTASNGLINEYMTGANSKTLTISIPEDLGASFKTTLTLTVTNSIGKSASKTVEFIYSTAPVPVINSITPSAVNVTDTGKATFKANATGDGLTYEWTSDNEILNAYLSGVNTNTLTINIAQILEDSFTATVTCTVTNSYGKTASADATFEYVAEFDGGSAVVMQGDIDGDGVVNAKDTNMVRRIVCGVVTADENQVAAGDVNGDGKINGMDANILTRYAAGVIEEF